jgi:RNA polymerase sigma factor (sigma-70 family)
VAISPNPKDPETTGPALGSQLQAYGPELHRYLLRRVRDRARAEDLVQEAFERVLRRYESGDPGSIESLQAYLYTVAGHLAHELQRRTKRDCVRYGVETPDRSGDINPWKDHTYESVSTDQEMNDRLNSVEETLRELSEPQRKMFELSVLGFKLNEIAAQLGYAPGTVNQYLKRARKIFRLAWMGK